MFFSFELWDNFHSLRTLFVSLFTPPFSSNVLEVLVYVHADEEDNFPIIPLFSAYGIFSPV